MSFRIREEYLSIAERVRREKSVVPQGTGRHWITKYPEREPLCSLDLNGILEVSREDLYVSVQSGVKVQELRKILWEEGLFLPTLYEGTVGGMVARDLPEYFQIPRDTVLGAVIITGDGKVIKSGGRTTKFSSGYKLYKAVAGSHGRLGFITEVTLRVMPRPERVGYWYSDTLPDILKFSPFSVIYTGGKWMGVFAGLERTASRLPFKLSDGLPPLPTDKGYISFSPLGEEWKCNSDRGVSVFNTGFSRLFSKREEGKKCLTFREGDMTLGETGTYRRLKSALDPQNKFPA